MKRIVMAGLIMLAASLSACGGGGGGGGDVPAEPAMATVYIDPDVAATGNGTASAPYKRWSDVTFTPGTLYVQKKGTIAREQVTITAAGTADKPIILGAYGTGNAPIIQGSEPVTGWTVESGSIYRKSMSSAGIGIVVQDSVPLTFLPWDTDVATTFASATAGAFSFNRATNTLYVWCSDSNSPDSRAIEAGTRPYGILGTNCSYITIDGLKVRWAALHGIAFRDSNAVTVQNSTITGCGGSWSSSAYAGNGVEFGNSVANGTVLNCTISDIFDSGIAVRTYASSAVAANLSFAGNTITRSGYAGIDVAVLPGYSNAAINTVAISGNSVYQSGTGWSGIRAGGGAGILVSADSTAGSITGVSIAQSILALSKGHGISLAGKVGAVDVSRAKISTNGGDGIHAEDAHNPSTMKLRLTSSLLLSNTGNGVSFNVPSGQGFQVYQNTFYDNGDAGFSIAGHTGTADLRNNIFSSSSPKQHFSSVALTAPVIDYNDYHENGGTAITYAGTPYTTVAAFSSVTLLELHGIGTDPMFTNVAGSDFTLQGGSPCKSSGASSLGVAVDYKGIAFGSPPSRGAYQ